MKRIFLGRLWHWGLLAAITGTLWLAGARRLHVVEFNIFVLSLIAGVALAVIAILLLTEHGEQVTRDRLKPPEES